MNGGNELLSLFPEGSIDTVVPCAEQLSKEKHKAIGFRESDHKILIELLKTPSLLAMMPKKVKGKYNRMVVWCVQELVRRVKDPDYTQQQTSLKFDEDDFRNELLSLGKTAERLEKIVESLESKKGKWWKF